MTVLSSITILVEQRSHTDGHVIPFGFPQDHGPLAFQGDEEPLEETGVPLGRIFRLGQIVNGRANEQVMATNSMSIWPCRHFRHGRYAGPQGG